MKFLNQDKWGNHWSTSPWFDTAAEAEAYMTEFRPYWQACRYQVFERYQEENFEPFEAGDGRNFEPWALFEMAVKGFDGATDRDTAYNYMIAYINEQRSEDKTPKEEETNEPS